MLQQLLCLMTAIYFEAGNQDLTGKIAVGNVIMNRVSSNRYPDSICDVVKQGEYYSFSPHPKKYRCQFTYWCDGKPEIMQSGSHAYNYSWMAAITAFSRIIDYSNGATHYHANYVKPNWSNDAYKVAEHGQHIFYRL